MWYPQHGPGVGYPPPAGWGTFTWTWMGYPPLNLDLGLVPLDQLDGVPPRNVNRQAPVKTVPFLVLRTRAVKKIMPYELGSAHWAQLQFTWMTLKIACKLDKFRSGLKSMKSIASRFKKKAPQLQSNSRPRRR